MSDLKVKVPQKVLKEFPEVDWDKIAERAVMEEFRKRISIRMLDELLKDSELTDEDIERLSEKVDSQVRKRIEKERGCYDKVYKIRS